MGAILKKCSIFQVDKSVIKILPPDVTGNPVTYLSDDEASGSTVLSVESVVSFAANDYVYIGTPGTIKCELLQVSSVSASAGTITLTSATVNNHEGGEPITLLGCNQISIERATAIDGSYSSIATANIEPTLKQTTYVDSSWVSTYYYKARYYNSTTATYGSYSGQVPGSDYESYSLMRMARKVLSTFPDKTIDFLVLSEIFEDINDAYRIVQNELASVNEEINLKLSTGNALTADTATYALPSDFKELKYVQVSYDGTNYNTARLQRPEDADPEDVFSETEPFYYFQGNYIGFRPTPATSSGYYKICYYYMPVELTDDDSLLVLPYLGFPEAFIDYAKARAFEKDGNYKKSDYHMKQFNASVARMLEQSKRTETDENIRITDPSFIEAMNEDLWAW